MKIQQIANVLTDKGSKYAVSGAQVESRDIDANPNATTKEVYQQAGRMMDAHGVGHKPIVPYK